MWSINMDKKNKSLRIIIDMCIVAVLVVIDRITKNMATVGLKGKDAYVLIEDVFELNYLENRGAAFGVLQNQKPLFVIIGILMLIIVMYVLIRLPLKGAKYVMLEIGLVLIAAGAIGNMTDRVMQSYVVDFFYFVLINFPIFNVADIYVTISCIIIAIMILFVFDENELNFLRLKKKAEDENNCETVAADEKI